MPHIKTPSIFELPIFTQSCLVCGFLSFEIKFFKVDKGKSQNKFLPL